MQKITVALRHILVLALAAALAVGPAAPALAEPHQRSGGNVAPGIVVPGADPNTWTITAPNGAIINFSNFDIHAGETVTFIQPSADARALNRIFSAVPAPTRIDGSLNANGQIYIVNQAGVFFGSGSQVNVNGLQAAAGRISDKDFQAGAGDKGVDHFTGLHGKVGVEEGAQITASAVSLVGGQVSNAGQITAGVGGHGGWIVMAAGRDVLIGRDGEGNGVLLRIEGAANAVFNKNATGVENTGSLVANADTDPVSTTPGAHISLGAGDLYGTAIFSSGAIEARKVALSADNRGNVALGGTVKTNELDATFAGNTAGELRGTGAAGSVPQTINADTVKLLATGDRGSLKVGEGLAFRGFSDATKGPKTVNVAQQTNLETSALAGLDIGAEADHSNTALTIASEAGTLAIDDRGLVNGTKLDISARTLIDVRGPEALDVESLTIHTPTILSSGDLIARGADVHIAVEGKDDIVVPVFDATTNIGMVTRPDSSSAVISAHGGTLQVTGDITASNGGGLRIEAKKVELGTVDAARGPLGGIIDVSGGIQPRVEIGFTDAAGVQQTEQVTLNAINAEGHRRDEKKPLVAGGDVVVNATGDVTVRSSISTRGDSSGSNTKPNLPGGSIQITTTGAKATLTVGSITTGGADAPVAPDTEKGNISLNAATIVATGDFDARGGTAGNADGSRDRSVAINGSLEVGADQLSISGGDVTFNGVVSEAATSATDPTPRAATLGVTSSGTTTFGSKVTLDRLQVDSPHGGDVVFGGNVGAEKAFEVLFDTTGTGQILTTGGPVTVSSRSVVLTAGDISAKDPTAAPSATLTIDPNVQFNLLDVADDPAVEGDSSTRGSFRFDQDAAIDANTTKNLFTLDRFSVTSPIPPGDHAGLALETVQLLSHAGVSLDEGARAAVADSDLVVSSASFAAPGSASALDLASLNVTTLDALTANFSVTAKNGVSLHSGAGGSGGDLTLTSNANLSANSITLIAGDGQTGPTGAKVAIDPAAQLLTHPNLDANGVVVAKRKVLIAQDADLATASLPDASVFGSVGDPLAGLDYQLESRDGQLTLSDGAAAKIAGSNLSLTGAKGIDLGTAPLLLGSLTAHTPEALVVSHDIATDAGGKIELHAGTDGSGDLSIASTLASDDISLFAGAGDGQHSAAVVDLQDGAHFRSADLATAPTQFTLEQDASIGENGGTQVPGAARFGDGSVGSIAGMGLALHSKGSSVRIADPTAVKDTALELSGKGGVTVVGDLDVQSLEATSGTGSGVVTSLGGSVSATKDVTLHSAVTLTGSDPNTTIKAGGNLSAEKSITKSTAGSLTLHADHALSVAGVATAHSGGKLTVEGIGSVTATGKLDTSSISSADAGGEVSVTSSGAIDIAAIDSHGAAGTAQTAKTAAGAGSNGGAISVTGSAITVGTVSSVAGPGGALLVGSSQTGSASGGAGGDITLNANSGDIGLKGNVIADGGDGTSTDPAHPAADLNGPAGNVTLNGNVRLLASRQTADQADDGPTNVIHGFDVVIGGDVRPGSLTDPNTSVVTPIAAGFTGLTVVANNSLSVAGDLTAGQLDLEVHSGPLALGTKTLNADEIRLAASDGQGGQTTGTVDLTDLTFHGSNGTGPVATSFTLEQDASIGGSAGGTPIPNLSQTFGVVSGRTTPFKLGLISQDDTVVLDGQDVANVNGTNLLLAANGTGLAGETPIQVTGADLVVPKLSLGTETGVGGVVGGNTSIGQNLEVGTNTAQEDGDEVLTAGGDLSVTGVATVHGNANFVGSATQTLQVGSSLELFGSLSKTKGDGKFKSDFVIDSHDIKFSDPVDSQTGLEIPRLQSIGNIQGALSVLSPIVKTVAGGVSLLGTTADDTRAAVTVTGTDPNGLAVETSNGEILISATTQATPTSPAGVGTYQLNGGVRAVGDVILTGQAKLVKLPGGPASYQFEAERNLGGTGGELTMSGIASADGDVFLVGAGRAATADVLRPNAIHLKGDFDVAHELVVDGTTTKVYHGLFVEGTTDVSGDTTIAAGDVEFHSRIQGANDLNIKSQDRVVLYDDVAMTAGAFAAGGNNGVLFVSAADQEQSIEAGSISLGNGATNPAKGLGSLLRNGDLRLSALNGNVVVGRGQKLIVNGALNVAASGGVTLADTAALNLNVNSSDFGVYGGTTLVANSINVNQRPHVFGGGGATFAVPTRTEVSGNVPSDGVLVRAISPSGKPLSFGPADDGSFDPEPPFPLSPDFVGFNPTFPTVTGSALFDFSREIPRWPARQSITRPHADPVVLKLAVEERPLWAEELLAYLEQRSIEPPNETGRLAEAQLLPPVGARPGEPLEESDVRVRGAAVQNAVALYRNLFRPDLRRDPETGVIDAPSQAGAIRAAFQAPTDIVRRAHSGRVISGADVAKVVESDSKYDAARRYREQLGSLLDVAQRALTPDQRPRFRELVLAEVTPYGLSPTEFGSLF
jgi:filamentous hemagglutinin family protein